MLSFWIIEKFNIVEHVLPRFFASGVGFPPDPLTFKKMKKTFRHGIIIAIAAAAHAWFQVMRLKEILPLETCKRAPLIRMNNNLWFWFAPPNGHQQRA